VKHPDEIAACARRLAAKMIADQRVNCMLTIVGVNNVTGDVATDLRSEMDSDDFTVVVVAKRGAAMQLMGWLDDNGPPRSVEAVPAPEVPR
jgi:hypothetical protein